MLLVNEYSIHVCFIIILIEQSLVGPAGALIAYGIIGFIVFWVTFSLGEMATYIPVSNMQINNFVYNNLLTHLYFVIYILTGFRFLHSFLSKVCRYFFWYNYRL